jgi:hypothetical protein
LFSTSLDAEYQPSFSENIWQAFSTEDGGLVAQPTRKDIANKHKIFIVFFYLKSLLP